MITEPCSSPIQADYDDFNRAPWPQNNARFYRALTWDRRHWPNEHHVVFGAAADAGNRLEKALGAQRHHILYSFLRSAALLCGGVAGSESRT